MAYDQIMGFKFDPEDDELIYYLNARLQGQEFPNLESINEINVYKYDPWVLPPYARVESNGMWHFFTRLENKHSKGDQKNRTTHSGRWKMTGKDRDITTAEGDKIGTIKTLVFYIDNQQKTNWIMYEYSLCSDDPNQRSYVVCKLKNKEEY